MSFNFFPYFQLRLPLCSAEQNHLGNFGRGPYEEQLGNIILNLGQWFLRRYCLKKKFIDNTQRTKTDQNSSPGSSPLRLAEYHKN